MCIFLGYICMINLFLYEVFRRYYILKNIKIELNISLYKFNLQKPVLVENQYIK